MGMSWIGKGAIAIWNDITPEGRANFHDWHGREHIPERVGIPGFLDGRRYVGVYGTPEYFTLYLTVAPEIFRGEDYARRLNAPTTWTLESTAHFRNVARALCDVERSVGDQVGGLIGTWRCDPSEDKVDAFRAEMAALIDDLATHAGVAGAHLLTTDMGASQVDNAERKRRGDPNAVPPFVLLVEGWDEEAPFAELCRAVNAAHFAAHSDRLSEHGLYRLQTLLSKADLAP
jgi:hypothetical protein